MARERATEHRHPLVAGLIVAVLLLSGALAAMSALGLERGLTATVLRAATGAVTPRPSAPIGPISGPLSTLQWTGNQVISTSVAYRNSSISLSGGNLIVARGGSLTLDNVSLSISQFNATRLLALSHGFIVESGGQLLVKYASIRSANGSSYPGFGVFAGSTRAFHVGFADLGGTGGSPVAGREGLHISAAHVTLQNDQFNSVYQLLLTGTGAVGDAITGSSWVNSTITTGQIGWLQVDDGASWANLSYDNWFGAADAGMLALVSGPHTTIANSTFEGDPAGTQQYQVYLTYNGYTDSGVDASYGSIVYDRFQTANLGISDGDHFLVAHSSFNDTGHWPSTGGAAAIIVVTWIGSGVGEQTRDVDIEQNTITNFTHYAIRVSQNVSGFNVSGNRIFECVSTYSTAITEADGIYLIRGVNNGTVWDNVLDMTDRVQSSEPTNGVVLEAQVNEVNVSDDRLYNCSEVGITVQGDSGALSAPAYYLGPSRGDVLFDNRIANFHSVAAQTMYSTEAIETWMWANGTRIVDNDIVGWTQVDTADYWNGAGILTSSSEQAFEGNTMTNVRFGFVFEKFDAGQELKRLGSFNRSYNVLDGNVLSSVTVASVAENAIDDMGPVVNLLTGPAPANWTFWFSGSNATLRVQDATLSAFGASSPYRVANIRFDGSVQAATVGTAFDFALGQWISAAPSVGFGGFLAQIGTTTGWYNMTVANYSSAPESVRWSALQSASATDVFELTGPSSGSSYNFSVDGAVTTLLTATLGTLTQSWTGSGSHTFAFAVAGAGTSGSGGGSPLTARASAPVALGTAPLTVHFVGNASGGTAPYSFSWRFGDGGTSTLASPTHTYASAGTYRATLTVTDAAGTTANASVSVLVLKHGGHGVFGLGSLALLSAGLWAGANGSPQISTVLTAGPGLPAEGEPWWVLGLAVVGLMGALVGRANRRGP